MPAPRRKRQAPAPVADPGALFATLGTFARPEPSLIDPLKARDAAPAFPAAPASATERAIDPSPPTAIALTGSGAATFPIATELEFWVERPWDGAPKGQKWRAIAVHDGRRFSGIGPCTWSALREALLDYQERGVEGRAFRPARTA